MKISFKSIQINSCETGKHQKLCIRNKNLQSHRIRKHFYISLNLNNFVHQRTWWKSIYLKSSISLNCDALTAFSFIGFLMSIIVYGQLKCSQLEFSVNEAQLQMLNTIRRRIQQLQCHELNENFNILLLTYWFYSLAFQINFANCGHCKNL